MNGKKTRLQSLHNASTVSSQYNSMELLDRNVYTPTQAPQSLINSDHLDEKRVLKQSDNSINGGSINIEYRMLNQEENMQEMLKKEPEMDSNISFSSRVVPIRKFSKNFVHGTRFNRTSSYFSDNKRCIDFVLAYEPEQLDIPGDSDSEDEEDISSNDRASPRRHVDKRKIFESNLQLLGLQLEYALAVVNNFFVI